MKVLKIGKERVPLAPDGGHIPVTCHVAAIETSTIPGKHQMQVPVYALDGKLQQLETIGMIEPLSTFMENSHLLVAHSLSVCVDGHTSVFVVNLFTAHTTIHSSVGSTSVDDDVEVPAKTPPKMISIDQFGSKSNLPEDRTQEFTNLLQDFHDIFVYSYNDLGKTPLMKHSIQLKGTAVPIRQYYRRVPFSQRPTMKCLIDKMLKNNIIEPSSGPWASPVVLVKKKDGTLHFCVDFQKLNSVTQKDAEPIPRIDETLEQLSGSCYFLSLDLASGYWQVPMEDSDKPKTAFTTPFGLY